MCGIVGITADFNVRDDLLKIMLRLWHRGQDSAGAVFMDHNSWEIPEVISEPGVVKNLIMNKAKALSAANGVLGLGHLRYRTNGSTHMRNAQPFFYNDPLIGMVHNGQIENMGDLEQSIREKNISIETESDSELLLKSFAIALAKNLNPDGIFNAVRSLQHFADGSYSCIVPIPGTGLLAFRDPRDYRPLALGEKRGPNGNAVAFASEDQALLFAGYRNIQTLDRGEAVFVGRNLEIEKRTLLQMTPTPCAFEQIYFMDSRAGSVYGHRYEDGKLLARQCESLWPHIDIVVPIPNSARAGAHGFCNESKLPYLDLVLKEEVRTFTKATQVEREAAAETVYSVIPRTMEGKNIFLLDDSLVRGTTARKLVRMVRDAGASNVYFGSTFPPVQHQCRNGIYFDAPLIAIGRNDEQRRKFIEADALVWARTEDVLQAIGVPTACMACVTGEYPSELYPLSKAPKIGSI